MDHQFASATVSYQGPLDEYGLRVGKQVKVLTLTPHQQPQPEVKFVEPEVTPPAWSMDNWRGPGVWSPYIQPEPEQKFCGRWRLTTGKYVEWYHELDDEAKDKYWVAKRIADKAKVLDDIIKKRWETSECPDKYHNWCCPTLCLFKYYEPFDNPDWHHVDE